MKGTIRQNLGGSRYIVGIQVNAEPVTALLADLNLQYDDISQKLIQAQGELLTAQEPYNALLDQIDFATLSYQACVDEFNLGQCVDAKTAICQATHSTCEDECYEIESGEGECDFECQKARDACKDRCQREREACLAQVNVDCQEQFNQHVTKCQETWSPVIAGLQQQALELMPPIQDILTRIAEAEAQQLSLARRITELQGVQSREEQVTCWRAQYDDSLSAGTAVDVARTPAGRHVITELVSPSDACIQDARGLPAKHLFNNAALYPGFETWRPTWRTGTVTAVNADSLTVTITSGTMTGGLGTPYTRNPIDCTPSPNYFAGTWQASAARIQAARTALAAAQTALGDAAQVRDDCIAQYDQTWSNVCYTEKAAQCDITWANWLESCINVGEDPAACMEQYEASLAACYAQALAACSDEREALIQACREAHQPAVDAAQAVVDSAERTLRLELAGIYQPAAPLILTLPVAHCEADSYQIGDDVLVDFPTRTGSATEPMAVWNSGRVIGWASNTRECWPDIYWPPLIELVIECSALRQGTSKRILRLEHIEPVYPCGSDITMDCKPQGYTAIMEYADWFVYDTEVTSYYLHDSFLFPGFSHVDQPGISHRTTNFTFGETSQTQTNTYIFRNDACYTNFQGRVEIRNTNIETCPYPALNMSNGQWETYGAGSVYITSVLDENIGDLFTLPQIATLRHDASGKTKQYAIDMSRIGHYGKRFLDDNDWENYNARKSIYFYPIEEE